MKKMDKRKLFCIINVFLIFGFGFITHNVYKWFPSLITTIFPVNESLYEHLKMIFITPLIASTILFIIFKIKKIKINNYLLGLFCSTISSIIIFYIFYLPLYSMFGEIMIVTLSVYLLSIILSQIINYYLIKSENNSFLNIMSFIMIIISMIILLYFTYNPIRVEFFRDPIENIYGLNKK